MVVHRVSLLRKLVAPLPTDRLHAGKKFSHISASAAEGIEVTFQDGQAERFDVVIGADGILGAVRRYVLQEAEASTPPCGLLGLQESRPV